MKEPVRLSLLCGVFALGCGDDPEERAGHGAPSAPQNVESVRVFAGHASMLFDGPSCSGEPDVADDRWCAFVARSSSDQRNLFVVNVSQVIAGVPVTCDAADPNCLLLTPVLGGDSADPTRHGTLFQGDSLVYYDETLVPYVWRPGMSGGRLLVDLPGQDSVYCMPAPRGTAVACLTVPVEQEDPSLARADLVVGKADAESEPLLSAVDSVIVANAADQVQRFGYGFPPLARDYIAWSSREDASGPETLKLHQVGDPASTISVASDVHDWNTSPDGTRWFWLSAIDANGVGTLQTAPFPGGESVTDVIGNVLEFGVTPFGGGSVVARTFQADLVAIADPIGAPETQITLDSRVRRLLDLTAQGHIAYAKTLVGTTLVDLVVSKVDGSERCEVDATVTVPARSVHFSPDSKMVVWARSTSAGFEGFHTRLSDCSTTPLASNVGALGWIGDAAILFLDDFDSEIGTGSIRLRGLDARNQLALGDPTLVARHVDTYAISEAAGGALVYTVNADSDDDGVWVRRLAR